MLNKKARVKIFAVAKDEAAYIPQWVHHHFYFGFSEIEIWLNNIEDNSVEVCEKLTKHYEGFKFKLADEEFNYCVENALHFQRESYDKIFKKELKENRFSHILFIDLDEFWTPKDFKTNIQDYLEKYPGKDSIAFSWYFDEASYCNAPFSRTFERQQLLFRDRHVKSIVKVSDSVNSVSIHNHNVDNGNYILSNGTKFDVLDTETASGSLIPKEQFVQVRCDLDEVFIYHTIFKSQLEYVSSLLRGNKQALLKSDDTKATDLSLFKKNRFGYQNSGKKIVFEIEQNLVLYNESYNDLLEFGCLFKELLKAQSFLVNRYYKAKELILSTEDTNHQLFTKILSNVKLEGIKNY